ncbi:MAG: alpha-amylase family glycosyl hydrolase, partial [Limnochordia bacterium]|nr:alpha-amylase family glycosyl hydrolase [Limnochordia bacterium]
MLKWWQERVVYQVYPRSFQDSNGDGIGDLQGIISHLDELADLGVGIIWLSPVYPSPNVDNGYDISDYKGIHPEFGTMADMDELLVEAKKRDIRLVMDLVINHTSDQHAWFQQSRDKESPYRDYYIWRPGRGKKPPNNWSGFFGGRTWQYDDQSGEYYLHLFAKNQPDLNYRNPKVLEEVKDIMRFWLAKGVAGFRCDVINILYKSSLAQGRRSLILTGSEHYLSQEGTHKILRTLRREVLDHFDCFTVGETVFVTPRTALDLMGPERQELDMIFSFEHMETDQYIVKWFKRRFHAGRFAQSISKWQNAL